ncbi:hypothetical protein [Hymenobacter cavernae]|uniref:Uncharacterized protein n=1 Tax=Hymenobacter cavernae TaxID=2044852 RepID=A0ABQ1USW7_9BACT|nr:hypothetical protein [Hymenobacter cavernae]GGF26300.1 hypothetical protein GCM10011383_42260 [Hymenobacter cavernae]
MRTTDNKSEQQVYNLYLNSDEQEYAKQLDSTTTSFFNILCLFNHDVQQIKSWVDKNHQHHLSIYELVEKGWLQWLRDMKDMREDFYQKLYQPEVEANFWKWWNSIPEDKPDRKVLQEELDRDFFASF